MHSALIYRLRSSMLSISMTTADILGNVIINSIAFSDIDNIKTRVSRSATLDGGAVIVNSGVSHGDRTFQISEKVLRSDAEKLKYIQENSVSVSCSTPEGLFLGVISETDYINGILRATILIKSKDN